jgi:sigma-B regulation protein RsbU (phosphoserine phosphatase)
MLCEGDETDMFVTVWLGILTISTGELICANAGHEYPAISHGGEAYRLEKTKHGPPLGIFAGVTYEEECFTLRAGDTLFLYTDGLPEATNPYREMFGEERMLSVLDAHQGASAEEMLTAIRQAVDRFVDGGEPFDDLTMLAVRILR